MEVKNEKITVEQITRANFWKMVIWPPNSATPAKNVVTVELKMLTPISWNADFVLADLWFATERLYAWARWTM